MTGRVFFWVGGASGDSSNWSNSMNWASESGGVGGTAHSGSYPDQPGDIAIVDDGSAYHIDSGTGGISVGAFLDLGGSYYMDSSDSGFTVGGALILGNGKGFRHGGITGSVIMAGTGSHIDSGTYLGGDTIFAGADTYNAGNIANAIFGGTDAYNAGSITNGFFTGSSTENDGTAQNIFFGNVSCKNLEDGIVSGMLVVFASSGLQRGTVSGPVLIGSTAYLDLQSPGVIAGPLLKLGPGAFTNSGGTITGPIPLDVLSTGLSF